MIAGALRWRVRIERMGALIDDGLTKRPSGWVVLADAVPAEKKPGRGSERVQLAARDADAPVTFRLRWSSEVADVNPKDQLIFEGKPFDIKSVAEIGVREGLEIVAMVRADT